MRETIDERISAATREVASAFGLPLHRVEVLVDRLKREALERAFGEAPHLVIAEELAAELRAEVGVGLEWARGERRRAGAVVTFPNR